MAITLVESPSTSAPIDSTDYDKQNALISANEVPDLSFLSDWEATAAAPLLKQGVYIYHAGNTYIVDTADYAINGTLSTGKNYIEMVISGSTLVATWTQTITGYSFYPAYGGIYDTSGNQLLPDICYLDGSDYIRGRSFGMGYNFIHLATGDFLINGDFNTYGGDVNTDGGDVNTDGGDIKTNTGTVITLGGNVVTTGGDIYTNGGNVEASSGSITTTAFFSGHYKINSLRGFASGTTQSAIFTLINPYLYSTVGHYICRGTYGTYPILSIYRINSTSFYIYYSDNTSTLQTITITSGSSSTLSEVLTVAI